VEDRGLYGWDRTNEGLHALRIHRELPHRINDINSIENSVALLQRVWPDAVERLLPQDPGDAQRETIRSLEERYHFKVRIEEADQTVCMSLLGGFSFPATGNTSMWIAADIL
jgi:hypothetical protein